ncbi:MAG: hypothetical protein AAB573_00485 [Patescibacteria group bacterium]
MADLEKLKGYGATVDKDAEVGAHIVVFKRGDTRTTFTIGLESETKADLAILTMTTKPDEKRSLGYGSLALWRLLTWAMGEGFKDIRARQVQSHRLDAGNPPTHFWLKNNFRRRAEPNPTNDYQFIRPRKKP